MAVVVVDVKMLDGFGVANVGDSSFVAALVASSSVQLVANCTRKERSSIVPLANIASNH